MKYQIIAQKYQAEGHKKLERVVIAIDAHDIMQALNFARKEFIAKQIGIFEIIEIKKFG